MAPPSRLRMIDQNAIQARIKPITVQMEHEKDVSDALITADILNKMSSGVGLSLAYHPFTHRLTAVAIAVPEYVLVIQVYADQGYRNGLGRSASPPDFSGRLLIGEKLFEDAAVPVYSFDAHVFALEIFTSWGQMRINNLVDLQSLAPSQPREPLNTVRSLLTKFEPDEVANAQNINDYFSDLSYDAAKERSSANARAPLSKEFIRLVHRAWLAQHIGGLDSISLPLSSVPRIDTRQFSSQELHNQAKNLRDLLHSDHKQSRRQENDFRSGRANIKDGKLTVHNERYQNKIRNDHHQHIELQLDDGHGPLHIAATVNKVNGRSVELGVPLDDSSAFTLVSVNTIGKPGMTVAELNRSVTILRSLQKKITMRNHWTSAMEGEVPSNVDALQGEMDNLTMQSHRPSFLPPSPPPLPIPIAPFARPLNVSQETAVTAMLSFGLEDKITVIHGPPGTGKTTVIAAFVKSILQATGTRHKSVWLVAQSNVAIKNIAEKLASSGIQNWRLLVAEDFHFEWHSHLYTDMQSHVILSTSFREKDILPWGINVLLCTISMLSNPNLARFGFFKRVPLQVMVVDEASQIDVGDYHPILLAHGKTLEKVAFIGDDKQLPPFGQESNPDLESVFEKAHLRENALLLDTQYRMPSPIGDYISNKVYMGELRSFEGHPVHNSNCCKFFDVPGGKEVSDGTSWKNLAEVDAIIYFLRHHLLVDNSNPSFRIITPYDSQRSLLESTLKEHCLPSDDKCFNVDSFQGNEDDVIIISVVRTHAIGFLNDFRRTNVMLSRCKRAMYIFSQRSFLDRIAHNTLVGTMSLQWGDQGWVRFQDLTGGNFNLHQH